MHKLVLTLILYFGLVIIRSEQKNQKIEKIKKNNRKNRTVKKNWLKFWKNRQVWFYKPKTKKTEPNRNKKKPSQTGKKPSQTEKPRPKPVWTGCPKKPNWTETCWFELVSVFFLKFQFDYFFLIKTEPNKKWSPLITITPKIP